VVAVSAEAKEKRGRECASVSTSIPRMPLGDGGGHRHLLLKQHDYLPGRVRWREVLSILFSLLPLFLFTMTTKNTTMTLCTGTILANQTKSSILKYETKGEGERGTRTNSGYIYIRTRRPDSVEELEARAAEGELGKFTSLKAQQTPKSRFPSSQALNTIVTGATR
jgi:hypothetical protein